MENKFSGYRDQAGEPLNDGGKVDIEFFERGYWAHYNTVKIAVSNDAVLVTEYIDYIFAPAPDPIITFIND